MLEIKSQPTYYVAFFETKFKSIDEIKANAPEVLAAHIERSNELCKNGKVLMAGALRSKPDEPINTMAVFYTQEDAEEYAKGDPFVRINMVTKWYVKEWANILKD